MAEERTATEQLTSLKGEMVKQHVVLDGNKRAIAIYEATVHVSSGEPCLLTRYKYESATSTTIINRVESNSVWNPTNDPTWDELEPLP